jgi:outer membrane protein assembly factor BamB
MEALDRDGKRKWFYQRPLPSLALRSAAPMLQLDAFILTGFPGGKLVAIQAKNGAPVWEGTVAQPKGATELERIADIVSEPSVVGDTGCAVAYQGRVTCFDFGEGGSTLWSREISSWAGLSSDGRSVYLTGDESVLHAIDMATGSSRWKNEQFLHRRLTAPQSVNSRFLVAGDAVGYLHVINKTDGAPVGRQATDGTPLLVMPRLLGEGQIVIQTQGGLVEALDIR